MLDWSTKILALLTAACNVHQHRSFLHLVECGGIEDTLCGRCQGRGNHNKVTLGKQRIEVDLLGIEFLLDFLVHATACRVEHLANVETTKALGNGLTNAAETKETHGRVTHILTQQPVQVIILPVVTKQREI